MQKIHTYEIQPLIYGAKFITNMNEALTYYTSVLLIYTP